MIIACFSFLIFLFSFFPMKSLFFFHGIKFFLLHKEIKKEPLKQKKFNQSMTTKFVFQSPTLKNLFRAYKNEQRQEQDSAVSSVAPSNSTCLENDFIVKTKTFPVSKTKAIQVLPPNNDLQSRVQKIQVQEQNQLPPPSQQLFKETHILVENIDTINAALCLRTVSNSKEQKQNENNDDSSSSRKDTVVALSFANDEIPGGYYRGGARAQEEDLCRTIPELYDSLIVNNKSFYPLLEGEAILSQDLFVLRNAKNANSTRPNYSMSEFVLKNAPQIVSKTKDDENDEGGKKSEQEQQKQQQDPSIFFDSIPKISIITAAMPRGLGDKRPAGGFMNPESAWHKTVSLRVRAVLTAAKISGKKDLVLGAWGAGAFNNNPKYVAQIFRDHLTENAEFVGFFDRIVFAIIDPLGTGNLKPFLEVFS
jgi:hypothetical protein